MTTPPAAPAIRARGHGPVPGIRAAIGLLTRLPVAGADDDDAGAWAFGLVGVGIGLIAAIPLVVFGAVAPVPAAVLAVAVVAVVTGVTHLDGLADTADALVASSPEAAERARTDPRLGTGGASALFVVLALDVSLLGQLAATVPAALVAGVLLGAGGVSRAVPVILARAARGKLGPPGLGRWFAEQVSAPVALVATLTGTAPALAWALVVAAPDPAESIWPVAAAVLGGLVGLPAALLIAGRRGQLDGDLFGASVEVSFALALTAAVVAIGLAAPGSPG